MNLKTFRTKQNLKQKDMQQILGMNNISQYQELEKDIENGKILSIKHALILSERFNISLDDIYEITPEEKKAGIGHHPLTLSDEEYDWIEIRSELLRIMGDDYVQTLKKMLQAIIDKNGKLSQ